MFFRERERVGNERGSAANECWVPNNRTCVGRFPRCASSDSRPLSRASCYFIFILRMVCVRSRIIILADHISNGDPNSPGIKFPFVRGRIQKFVEFKSRIFSSKSEKSGHLIKWHVIQLMLEIGSFYKQFVCKRLISPRNAKLSFLSTQILWWKMSRKMSRKFYVAKNAKSYNYPSFFNTRSGILSFLLRESPQVYAVVTQSRLVYPVQPRSPKMDSRMDSAVTIWRELRRKVIIIIL